jgi:deoxyhypusine synthase
MEPELATASVLQESEKIPEGTPIVEGYDWNKNGINYEELLKSYSTSGFQATNFGLAVNEINKMLTARNEPLEEDQKDGYEEDDFIKRKNNCTIFLGYTSNIVSSGLRETIRFLVQHKLVDCIVTTAGECHFLVNTYKIY